MEICRTMNERPLMTLRANTIRTTRETLMARLRKLNWNIAPTKHAPNGIRVLEPPETNLFAMQEFK